MPISDQPALIDRRDLINPPQKEPIMQSSFESLSLAVSSRERDLQSTAARVRLAHAAQSPRPGSATRRPSAVETILAGAFLRLRTARRTAAASIAQ